MRCLPTSLSHTCTQRNSPDGFVVTESGSGGLTMSWVMRLKWEEVEISNHENKDQFHWVQLYNWNKAVVKVNSRNKSS